MNLHLRIAEKWPGAFAGLNTEFVFYPEGRNTGDLIADGRIHLGGTGSTPPIITEAAGRKVTYLAASTPRPANGALLVAPNSPIETIADVAGKRIALIDGSFHTYLLAKTLEQAGLGLGDVIRHEMSPARSRAALLNGEVDVWIAMAPQLDQALTSGEARLLSLCGSVIPNRSTFWTLKDADVSDDELRVFVRELIAIGRKIAAEPEKAADILAGSDSSGTDRAAWKKVIVGRDWQIVPASAALIAEQQAEADTFHRHGDLAGPVHITSFLALEPADA